MGVDKDEGRKGARRRLRVHGGRLLQPHDPQFPPEYWGDYFFADFCGGWIRTYDPETKVDSEFATGLSSVMDLEVSREGELYYLSRGSTGLVGKIGYAG
jgi:hypothetical protein